jgi:WS/DGAT/MGAT family acyltransferase
VKQLTGLDSFFLSMESRTVQGHVGSVTILDPATGADEFTLAHLTRSIEARLPLIPVFRQRLLEVPLGLDEAYWLDDADFDIEFHVREIGLPTPGSMAQLAEQVARLHARPLDRSRPLWEVYLISGLRDGHIAIYTKIHHSAADGISGVDIATALLDATPGGRPVPSQVDPFRGESPPDTLGLLARAALSTVRLPMRALRMATDLVESTPLLAAAVQGPVGRLLPRRGDGGAWIPGPGLRPPRTPFNASVTPHRRVAFAAIPLADIAPIRAALPGTTVNDVVMALCAGALRRWLSAHAALPDQPLVAAVPFSVRGDGDVGDASDVGNRVSIMLASLPTHLPTPVERLMAARTSMAAAKDHGALPALLLADATHVAPPAVISQAWRVAAGLRLFERTHPYNLFISNVPGPRVPLYMAGARMIAYYPVSAIFDGSGLNITLMSYCGTLYFGLTADRALVPDVDVLAANLRVDLDEMSSELGRMTT